MWYTRTKNKDRVKYSRSRRDFLFIISSVSLLFTFPSELFSLEKKEDEEEYIMINGWFLKKTDLYDI